MHLSRQEIQNQMGGRLVGNDLMRKSVSRAISLLPDEIAQEVIENIWFFSSDYDSYGYAFNGNDLKDKHLIFLSDALFHESENQIMYTILHEIGHIVLKHKNSIQYQQSKAEIRKQESEADQFAKKYLSI